MKVLTGGLGQAYDKIVLLDADVLPIWGYDDLFALQTPAGILMEKKGECYTGAAETSDEWSWHKQYNPICPHGTGIPKHLTDRVSQDLSNMGVNAGLWVLTPSIDEYNKLTATLDKPEVARLVRCFPWPEMQFATVLWSGRWVNIDIRYCSIGGYPRIEVLRGIHYAGLKPWQVKSRSAAHYAKFADFVLWRQFFTAMYWSMPQLQGHPSLKRLWEFCKVCNQELCV